jgi:hypothetical protein
MFITPLDDGIVRLSPGVMYPAAMPTRRIFIMTVVVGILMVPARSTVHHWGRRQLAIRQEGTFMHGVGEALVTIT